MNIIQLVVRLYYGYMNDYNQNHMQLRWNIYNILRCVYQKYKLDGYLEIFGLYPANKTSNTIKCDT